MTIVSEKKLGEREPWVMPDNRRLGDEYFKQLVVGRLGSIEQLLKELKEGKNDHERRLRKVEKLAYILVGVWTIVSGFLARHILEFGGK
jgi:hypothetical protein